MYQIRLATKLTSIQRDCRNNIYENIYTRGAYEALVETPLTNKNKHSAPWWSDTLEEFVERKKRAYRKWLETKKPQDREDYQKRRRKTQREITRAKTEYWEKTCEQVDRCMGNTRVNKAWKLIKTMRSNNKNTAGLSLISMNQWMTYYKELLTEDPIQFMKEET